MKSFADYGIDLRGRSGAEIQTICPECSHTRKKKKAPCLSVNTDKGVWFCQHCGWKGTLAEGADRPIDLHWRKPRYVRPEPKPKADLPEKVIQWFQGRGITEAVLIRNKIWHGDVYMPQMEGFATAIGFPYFRDGELINQKYRDGRKNFRMETGAERVLYGLDDIDPSSVIVVEGEMDKLAFEVAGVTSCISVPDGAPAENTTDYSSKFEFLETAKEVLDRVQVFILAVDNDAPGKRLEDELSRRFGRERCLRVEWPEGCKDANEVLLQHDSATLTNCLAEAQPYPVDGVFKAADVSDRILTLFQNGWEKGVSTGWEALDQNYTVRPGELTIVTGIPNSGKSNLLDALTVNLAKNHGWRFALFSPENQPLEDHMSRNIEKWAQEPFNDGPTKRMDRDVLESGMKWLDQHYTWILPDDDWTVDRILKAAKELVFRDGIRGLIIDPWNELEHLRPNNMTETEYVSKCLKDIRQFGRRHGVHVWIVGHPAKLHKGPDGNYPVPTPYDISGSAHWRNKADNCITIWRDFANAESAEIEIHIQKIRFRQIGNIGMVPMYYQKACATYTDTVMWGAEHSNRGY
ncbi:MAG: toprim domain-containing protein [Chloroflexi bacterium]|nr:toprim domain-containing protein [Chloroflexota bacterium]